jgi:hypothetical protein
MGLVATERGRAGQPKADIDVDQIALAVAAGYALTDGLVVVGGLRYNDVSAEVEVTGPSATPLTQKPTRPGWIPTSGCSTPPRCPRPGP